MQCAEVAAALTAVVNQDTGLRDWSNPARYGEADKGVTRAGKNYVERLISAQSTPQQLVRFRPDVIALKATSRHQTLRRRRTASESSASKGSTTG